MSTQKEESSKPDTTEQQPKAPQTGELDEKQLNTVTGGALLTYPGYQVHVGGTGPSSNGSSI
jgi:bacteriocin-like protein